MQRAEQGTVSVLYVGPAEAAPDLGAALADRNGSFALERVENVAAAEASLSTGDVDCLVIDVDLPDGDWQDLLGTFRGHSIDGPALVFAEAGSVDAEECLSAGADGYLRKAEGVGGLAALVASRVGRWRLSGGRRDDASPGTASQSDGGADAVAGDSDGDVEYDAGDGTRSGTDAKVAALHEVATELSDLRDEDRIFEVAVEAAENVLEFDMCYVGTVSDGHIHPRATNNRLLDEDPVIMSVDEGVAGKTYRTERTYVVDHPSNDPDANPITGDITSALSVPLPDIGVFQALSTEVGTFSGTDRELAELLVAHVVNAVERVRYEATVREERDRFAALFENVPDPVAYYRFEGGQPVAVSVNPAFEETFGYDAETVEGESLRELLVPESERSESDELLRRIRDGDVLDVEATRQTSSGPRSFLVRNAAIDPGAERQTGYAIYTDVSDLKRRERQLQRQNERLEEFTDIVSHDLRNPLSVAQGYLSLIADRYGEDDAVAETAAALDEMEAFIEDLLALARQGEVVDTPESTALSDVVRDAWSNVTTEEATLSCSVETTLVADPDRLRQLLENLFRNSVEHGGVDVSVAVGGLPDEDGFYVADDGPGIDPSARERVFDSGYSDAEDGTGIGLAIVDSVVEAHGWELRLTESETGGARFEFVV